MMWNVPHDRTTVRAKGRTSAKDVSRAHRIALGFVTLGSQGAAWRGVAFVCEACKCKTRWRIFRSTFVLSLRCVALVAVFVLCVSRVGLVG